MGSGNCCVYEVIGFFVGLFFIYSGAQQYLFLQKIKNTPTSKVEAVAIGLIELSGKALCQQDMASPITKNKCIYWKLQGEYYQSGKHGGWRNIYNDSSTNTFYLKDETGKILVDPNGAQVDIPSDNLFQGYYSGKGFFGMSHTQMDSRAVAFIDTLPPEKQRSFLNHRNENLKIIEYLIAEGDPLYVLGSAEPREGVASAVQSENLIVRKGKFDKTMFISDSGEQKLTQSVSGSVYWQIFGGLALSAICLFLLLLMFVK